MGRPSGHYTPPNPADLKPLTRDDEAHLCDVVEYGTKVAKKYFHYGEEIGEAVRDRMIMKVMRSARLRGHLTERREIHTILRRCYADEIRYRYGNPTARDTRGHHGNHLELVLTGGNGEPVEIHGHAHDGDMSDVEVRLVLEAEADRIERQWVLGSKKRGMSPEATVRTIRAMAENVGGNMTMQDIAEAAGVSKATVSRTARKLQERFA